MLTPTGHKTVQARILEYTEAILLRQGYEVRVGWTLVSKNPEPVMRAVDGFENGLGAGYVGRGLQIS